MEIAEALCSKEFLILMNNCFTCFCHHTPQFVA